MKRREVAVTRTPAGISWATAKALREKGLRVVGTVRKTSDADRLRTEFGADFVPMLADVTDETAEQWAASHLGQMREGARLAGSEVGRQMEVR